MISKHSMIKSTKHCLITLGRLMPAGFGGSLLNFAFNCAPDRFEKFSYLYANAPSQEHLLRGVAARGFSLHNIVDVGAYQGQSSRMARSVWPGSGIVMIEPNRGNEVQLQAVAAELNAALYFELLGP
jgi:hypothetical protein